MGYNLRSLLAAVGKSTGNPKAASAVWTALMQCMKDTLKTGKGVSVRKLLSITSIRTSIRDPSPGLKVRSSWIGWELPRVRGGCGNSCEVRGRAGCRGGLAVF